MDEKRMRKKASGKIRLLKEKPESDKAVSSDTTSPRALVLALVNWVRRYMELGPFAAVREAEGKVTTNVPMPRIYSTCEYLISISLVDLQSRY